MTSTTTTTTPFRRGHRRQMTPFNTAELCAPQKSTAIHNSAPSTAAVAVAAVEEPKVLMVRSNIAAEAIHRSTLLTFRFPAPKRASARRLSCIQPAAVLRRASLMSCN